jgi:hypothetical protein
MRAGNLDNGYAQMAMARRRMKKALNTGMREWVKAEMISRSDLK